MSEEIIGIIHDKDTLFLREDVGYIEGEDKRYEVTLHATHRHPIVQSEQTGTFFTLSWKDIVELAIKAGIDKQKTPQDAPGRK